MEVLIVPVVPGAVTLVVRVWTCDVVKVVTRVVHFVITSTVVSSGAAETEELKIGGAMLLNDNGGELVVGAGARATVKVVVTAVAMVL